MWILANFDMPKESTLLVLIADPGTLVLDSKNQSPVDDGIAFRATCRLDWSCLQVWATFSWGLLVTKESNCVDSLNGRKGSCCHMLLCFCLPCICSVDITLLFYNAHAVYLHVRNEFTGW